MSDNPMSSRPGPRCVYQTAGGAISPNCFLDLLSSDGKQLELLVLEGGSCSTKRVLHSHNGTYTPISLEPSVRRAIYFPTCAAVSDKTGELVELIFRELQLHLEPEEDDDLFCIAIWILSSWVWDFLPAPITLLIGGDVDQAFTLLNLLSACARRPLCLADVSASALRRLPVEIGPTILVNRADISPAVRALLRYGNVPGFLIAGAGKSLTSITGPRALFIGEDDPYDGWTENVLHVSLPPRWNPRYGLNRHDLEKIRAQVQPRALGYRLHYWSVNNTLLPDSLNHSELGRALLACVAGDPELEGRLTSVLERREHSAQRLNPLDPNRALVECLWTPVHEGRAISMADVSGRVNALLRSRGEIRFFSAIEVGWMAQKLALPRHRGQRNKEFKGTKDLTKRLHALARRFDLVLPQHDTCIECASLLPRKGTMAAEPDTQMPEKAADM